MKMTDVFRLRRKTDVVLHRILYRDESLAEGVAGPRLRRDIWNKLGLGVTEIRGKLRIETIINLK